MKCLVSLKIGPSSKKLDVNDLLQSLFFHAGRLHTLYLNQLREPDDGEIAEILQECPNLGNSYTYRSMISATSILTLGST